MFIGQIVKYSKVRRNDLDLLMILFLLFQTYLCGNTVPSGTKFKSKNQQMTIKFHSNRSVTRAGFKVVIQGKVLGVFLNFIF